MERVISWSLANRPIVIFLTIIWIFAGVSSLTRLPIDAVPDVTNIQVVVNTEAPGLSPPEVESLVTIPVEGVLLGLPKVEEVRSLSKYGLSQVTVVFREGTDLYFARQLVGERLASIGEKLPASVGSPAMGPIATGLSEIYQYELVGDENWDAMSLRTLQDWFVKRQLLGIDGVTEVNSFGGLEKEYQVVLSPQALQSYGLSYDDLFSAIENNNKNVGGGFLDSRGDQLLIRGLALASDAESLSEIVVSWHEGVPVLVKDVAEVEIGGALRQGAVTRDGTGEAVTGIVMMLAGENSRAVAKRVHERVEKLADELPEGVSINTFYDRTELVDRTLATVEKNLAEGALLVVLILFVFLGNFSGRLSHTVIFFGSSLSDGANRREWKSHEPRSTRFRTHRGWGRRYDGAHHRGSGHHDRRWENYRQGETLLCRGGSSPRLRFNHHHRGLSSASGAHRTRGENVSSDGLNGGLCPHRLYDTVLHRGSGSLIFRLKRRREGPRSVCYSSFETTL